MSEVAFFQDLAMLMSLAGLVAAVFSRRGWPKAIGYIFAGILMSEHTWGGSFLADVGSTQTFGQLGVVMLMFVMGLSFSAHDMRSMRGIALPCAVLDVVFMIWLGYTLGVRVFGWGPTASFFLGVAMCDSATTLLAKVIDEMGWGNRPFAKNVLGTSVCEDIICVGAIAVATGFAKGGSMSVGALSLSLGALCVFFLGVIVFGFVLVPRLLLSIGKRKDDEALLLALLGCCFFVVYIAYKLDFSTALGAFLVGIIGSSSDVRKRLGELVEPLKSMFAAVFFISIGLLVDPRALLDNAGAILIVTAAVMGGKFLNNFIGSLLVGLDVKTAVQQGMALAQIGEFAFMVAIVYTQQVENGESSMFQIAVGASLLTTLLNPTMIRLSEHVGNFAERRMPASLAAQLAAYRNWLATIGSSKGTPEFVLLKSQLVRLGVYAVLMLAVFTSCSLLPGIDFTRFSEWFEHYDRYFFFVLANVFALVMLPLVVSVSRAIGDELGGLLAGDADVKWRRELVLIIRFVSLVASIGLFFLEWTMLNLSLAPCSGHVLWIIVAVLSLTGVIGWRSFARAGHRATERFREALTAEERQEGMRRLMAVRELAGPTHKLVVGAGSPAVGSTVLTLNIRAKTGVSVVAVVRNGVVYRNIGPEWEFAVDDILVVVGEGSQVAALKDLLGIVS